MRIRSFTSIVFGLMLAASAGAQELVVNGGFETGDLTGWSLGNDASAFVGTYAPHSGTYELKLTPGSSTNEAYQVLATTPGDEYDISIWLFHDGGDSTSNSVAMDWNGSAIPGSPTVLQPSTGWVDYTYELSASTSATTIAITAHDPLGNIYLDDVSVKPAPEPATIIGLGLGAAALSRRLRRR